MHMDWCLNENELKRRNSDPNTVYQEFKYQIFFHFIITTGILVEFNHDAVLTFMLEPQLQRDLRKISANDR